MKKFFIAYVLFMYFNSMAMQMHKYLLELFPIEHVPTEYMVYKLLKARPLSTPIHYVAIPWTVLINKRCLNKVPTIKINGGFTICQHILYEHIIPLLKQMGVTVLFTPHASKSKTYGDLQVLPFPHFQKYGIEPAHVKDVYYSFIGCASLQMLGLAGYRVRDPLITMRHPADCVVKRRQNWHFWCDEQKQKLFSQEYMDVLARSRFALCPRGSGPSTIRFWEALQAGAIPVLLADDMSLPEEIDWDSAIVRVAEKDVLKIPTILAQISPEQEQRMREKCLKIHKQFCGDNFVSTIRHFYGEN